VKVEKKNYLHVYWIVVLAKEDLEQNGKVE
jgi:hypothetical protein